MIVHTLNEIKMRKEIKISLTNLMRNTNNNANNLILKTWKNNPKHLTFDLQYMEEQPKDIEVGFGMINILTYS